MTSIQTIQPQPYGIKELFASNNFYSRQRYWATFIFNTLGVFLFTFVIGLMAAVAPLIGLFTIPVIVISCWIHIVTLIKRERDAGINLWWALIFFLPFINIIVFIVFGCIGSAEQKNTSSAKGVIATYVALLFVYGALVGFALYSMGKSGADLEAESNQVSFVTDSTVGAPVDAVSATEPMVQPTPQPTAQ